MRVLVTRPFLVDGFVQEVGSDIDLPDLLARELVACNKAVLAGQAPVSTGPMTTETAESLVPRKPAGRRGRKET